MPRLIRTRPPRSVMIHTREGQPATGSPAIIARIKMNISARKEIPHIAIPMTEDKYKGIVV